MTTPKRLLIVEDSRSINRYLSEYLTEQGLAVHSAYSLQEAQEASKEEHFDYIVFDLTLPDGNAKNLIVKLIKDTKIIILTSNENQLTRDGYFKLGVLDYISKNNPMDYVCKQIEYLIEKIEFNSNYTILIVDDSHAIREMCREIFEMRNYRVLLSDTGKEALELIQKEKVDLVILDLFLPDISGLEILYEIRKDSSNTTLPIITLSSTLNNDHIAKVLKHGANDFISKPFSIEQVILRAENLIRDSHAEKEISARLAEVEMLKKRLDDAQKMAKIGSFEEDLIQNTLWWSKGLYEILGYKHREIEPSREAFFSAILEPYRTELAHKRQSLFDNPHSTPIDMEFEIITHDGRTCWFSANYSAIYDTKGRVEKVCGVMVDVTENRLLCNELVRFNLELEARVKQEVSNKLRSERQFRQLFENSYDALLLIDYQTKKIIDCNKTAQKLSGYPREELYDMPFYRFFNTMHEDTFQPILEGIVQNRYEIYDVSFASKGGETLSGQLSFNVFASEDSQLLLCNFRNLTEQYRIKEEQIRQQSLLVQQSKLASMGEMIGSIAHQWRQPINALAVKIQDIELAFEEKEITQEYVEQFVHSSMELIHFMSHTIDDFRNFFRPSKTTTHFRVLEELNKCIAMIQNQTRLLQIACEVHSELPDNFMMVGYQNELKQVLLNLLKNATDAIEEHIAHEPKSPRRIDIYLNLEGEFLKIEIKDTGKGVPAEVMEKIFDPYFTTKEQGKGTGIGLYMSKVIIEKNMKGKLLVENYKKEDGERGGAIFTLLVPLELKAANGDR